MSQATTPLATTPRTSATRRLFRQKRDHARFYAFIVQHVLKIGIQGAVDEYYQLCQYYNPSVTTVALDSTRGDGRNRNYDVPCSDKHRVINPWPGVTYDFYHANYVPTPLNKYRLIVAQSPTENTMRDFLTLIISHKIQHVIKPCVYPAKNENHEVWPEAGERKYGYFTLNHRYTMRSEKTHVTINHYSVEFFDRQATKITVKFTHYLWSNWPQHGVPETSDNLNDRDQTFFFIYEQVKNSKTPVLIHSTDGTGRSGTVATVFHAVDSLESRCTNASLFKSAKVVMRHRALAVSRAQQYLYTYEVIINRAIDRHYNEFWFELGLNTGVLINYRSLSREKLPQPCNKNKPDEPRDVRSLACCTVRVIAGLLLAFLVLALIYGFFGMPGSDSSSELKTSPTGTLAMINVTDHIFLLNANSNSSE